VQSTVPRNTPVVRCLRATSLRCGDRITQVDLRVSKILRFAGRRANVAVDVFNLFNTNAVYQYNTTYSTVTPATWLQPSQLVVARFAKLSVQFDF
jgi:hypothetical protein